jgi:hypothetical protein
MRMYAVCLRLTFKKMKALTNTRYLFSAIFSAWTLNCGYFKVLADIRDLLEMLLGLQVKTPDLVVSMIAVL